MDLFINSHLITTVFVTAKCCRTTTLLLDLNPKGNVSLKPSPLSQMHINFKKFHCLRWSIAHNVLNEHLNSKSDTKKTCVDDNIANELMGGVITGPPVDPKYYAIVCDICLHVCLFTRY